MTVPPDLDLEPLKSSHLGSLRLFLSSRFSRDTLTKHLATNPGLSWRVPSNGQYVVGAFWRRRPDIASIVEIDSGPFRDRLLQHVVGAARTLGCELVVAELGIEPHQVASWDAVGFEPVDTIVEYEKRGTEYDPPALEVPIRRYDPTELRPVLDLEHRSFPWLWRNSTSELAHYAEAAESEMWVAPAPNGIAGYVGVTVRGSHGHLDRLAVEPGARRRGLGSALVGRALDRLAARGARRVTLTTQLDNLRAQPLYHCFGFRTTGKQLTIYGRWLARPRDRTP